MELVIDDVTGFVRDHEYKRRYGLGCFKIHARAATPAERLEPFERQRRGLRKLIANYRDFARRSYIEQVGDSFDKRLKELKPRRTVYLDGLWQSEEYFSDIQPTIRSDLTFIPPTDTLNRELALKMARPGSVSLHVRWFDSGSRDGTDNVVGDYYLQAIAHMQKKVSTPHYFIFSDNPDRALEGLPLSEGTYTKISNNQGDERAWIDMWLMSNCQNFIMANSTFSWWGAWLSKNENKIVICPGAHRTRQNWDFEGQIPYSWLRI